MELMTQAQRKKLIANMAIEDLSDHQPVLKWFTPSANCTWLIIGYDEEDDVAFGLCDLGMGFPELGYVSLQELRDMTPHLPFRMPVERDLYWTPKYTLAEYARIANEKGGIIA